MRVVINVLAGLIFGLGLLVSGMANPAKVQNFLDLAGSFDPSLICVMLGAVVVTFLGYRLAFRRLRPVLVERFSLPTAKNIDRKVVLVHCSVSAGVCRDSPRSGNHLASIAGKGHAHLHARDAHWHRLGASSDTDEAA
jgi:hypothetical protein